MSSVSDSERITQPELSDGEATCSSSSPKENTSEPSQVSWQPFVCTQESIAALWTKLHEFPQVFDDFGKDDINSFVAKLLNRNNIFIDIGPGIGLAAGMACRPRLDVILHLVMFDRRLRGREPLFLEIMGYFFRHLQLRRMTAMMASDCKTAIKLVQRLGFSKEGHMRNAVLRDNKYFDLEIYGITIEDFQGVITDYVLAKREKELS